MVGLQAAQELPGFLLHEELVFGAPTGHRLPGTGHLRGSEMVSSVQTQVVLTSKSRDISRTSLSMLEASLCSLYFLGRPREAMPHLWASTVKQSRRLGQQRGADPQEPAKQMKALGCKAQASSVRNRAIGKPNTDNDLVTD